MTNSSTAAAQRQWSASLNLAFAHRRDATRIVHNQHLGPLRVLKPFYPEGEVCHTYLIHPPGGLVLGDELSIHVDCQQDTHTLITTPSAGKVYTVDAACEQQKQAVQLNVGVNACLEWLPQETLVFDGANGVLKTRVDLAENAALALWDVVCLGRPASELPFERGRCLQIIEIYRDGKPLLIERNLVEAAGDLQRARWGLNNANSFGSSIFSVNTTRDQREALQHRLMAHFDAEDQWGLTQKEGLLIARYIGNSASRCRQGFELLWRALRPEYCAKPAVAPRIWAT